MFNGYLSLGGVEIINAQRTAAYVRSLAPTLPLVNCEDCGDLGTVLDEVYASPLVDNAPWFDPNIPATGRFYGLYPLSIEGMEDSTRTAAVTQSIVDGGSVGATRLATRSIRVKGLMLAKDEHAMTQGMTWLRNALDPPPCSEHGGSCGGGLLCYYAACPELCAMWHPYGDTALVVPVFADVATSPAVYRDVPQGAMFKAFIYMPSITTPINGVVMEWGALNRENSAIITEQSGPVMLYRENRVPNPNFTTNVSSWTGVGSSLTRQATNGPEGVPSARVESGSGGGYGSGGYGSGPYGGVTGVGANEIYTLLPAFTGTTIASFALRSDAATEVTVSILGDADVVLASGAFGTNGIWQRFSLPYTGNDTSVKLQFEGSDAYDLAEVMVEAGQIPLPFFHGSMPWQQAAEGYIVGGLDNEYVVDWLGVPDASTSRMVWNGTPVIGLPAGEDVAEWPDGVCDSLPYVRVLQGNLAGAEMHIFTRLPVSPEDQTESLERTLHDVTTIDGPSIISTRKFSDGSIMREVDFVMVAGRPTPYGPTVTALPSTRMIDLETIPWADLACMLEEPAAIIDPDCPPVPAPPRPPQIPNSCVTDETFWQRYWLPIPAEFVSSWSGTSPRVTITSGTEEIRQVRVRAYPNPFSRTIDESSMWNHALNPKLGTANTTWGNVGGVGTATGRQTGTGPIPEIGAWWRATASGAHVATDFGVRSEAAGSNLVVAGEVYSFAVYARSSVTRNLKLRLVWQTSAGATVGSINYYDTKSATATTWTRFTALNLTAPATAAKVSIGVVGDTAAWASTQTLDVTGAQIAEGATVPAYWDGDTTATNGWYYGWTGTEEVSESLAVRSPVDPCSYCSEFIVSYLPAQTTLTVDAILERAFASVAGGQAQAANHLLYSADGAPMTWPELSCGMDYLFAIDVPEPLLDDVTVSVSIATKE